MPPPLPPVAQLGRHCAAKDGLPRLQTSPGQRHRQQHFAGTTTLPSSPLLPGPGEKRITLTFKAKSWTEVRKGEVIFSETADPGTREFNGALPLSFTVGNASNVAVAVDGKPFDPERNHAQRRRARFRIELQAAVPRNNMSLPPPLRGPAPLRPSGPHRARRRRRRRTIGHGAVDDQPDTADIQGTIDQVFALANAGSEVVRITVNSPEAAAAVAAIREGLDKLHCNMPLVGDFHFSGHKLLRDYPDCAKALAKYRINPGNVGRGDKARYAVRADDRDRLSRGQTGAHRRQLGQSRPGPDGPPDGRELAPAAAKERSR